jgi:hypothetical protein
MALLGGVATSSVVACGEDPASGDLSTIYQLSSGPEAGALRSWSLYRYGGERLAEALAGAGREP